MAQLAYCFYYWLLILYTLYYILLLLLILYTLYCIHYIIYWVVFLLCPAVDVLPANMTMKKINNIHKELEKPAFKVHNISPQRNIKYKDSSKHQP